MLSAKTIQELSKSLAPEVANEIFSSEEWVQFLHEQVPVILERKVGVMEEDLLFDLSMCIMDRMFLSVSSLP